MSGTTPPITRRQWLGIICTAPVCTVAPAAAKCYTFSEVRVFLGGVELKGISEVSYTLGG